MAKAHAQIFPPPIEEEEIYFTQVMFFSPFSHMILLCRTFINHFVEAVASGEENEYWSLHNPVPNTEDWASTEPNNDLSYQSVEENYFNLPGTERYGLIEPNTDLSCPSVEESYSNLPDNELLLLLLLGESTLYAYVYIYKISSNLNQIQDLPLHPKPPLRRSHLIGLFNPK